MVILDFIPYFQPEWFFTQILNWLRDHEDFLDSTIQPILDKSESPWISAQVKYNIFIYNVNYNEN